MWWKVCSAEEWDPKWNTHRNFSTSYCDNTGFSYSFITYLWLYLRVHLICDNCFKFNLSCLFHTGRPQSMFVFYHKRILGLEAISFLHDNQYNCCWFGRMHLVCIAFAHEIWEFSNIFYIAFFWEFARIHKGPLPKNLTIW